MSLCNGIKQRIGDRLSDILALRSERVFKDDQSFVTKGDLLCQEIILDYISSLDTKFDVISEEIDIENFSFNENKNYVVIDPIDGTENFTSGLKEWGISVSVYEGNKHKESMIGLPELNLWLQTGDSLKRFESRICGFSSSLTKAEMLKIPDSFEYRISGCCVYNVYNVIVGSFAKFENFKGANTWDILAGCNLALEHHLNIIVEGKAYQGEFLPPGRKYKFKIE